MKIYSLGLISKSLSVPPGSGFLPDWKKNHLFWVPCFQASIKFVSFSFQKRLFSMKYFFLTLTLVIILVSCAKKPVINPSREDMLRTGRWKISAGKLYCRLPSGKDTLLDYLNYVLPDCYKDNYIVFDSLFYGAVFTGATRCDASEGDQIPFRWRLTNNDNNMDLYHGFYSIYAVTDTIRPYHFDTTSFDPLVLDSLVKAEDTAFGYFKSLVVLDTIWDFKVAPLAIPNYDIYDAAITNFSQSSFTLNFSYITKYLDSTNHRAISPRLLPDTLRYIITFSNY